MKIDIAKLFLSVAIAVAILAAIAGFVAVFHFLLRLIQNPPGNWLLAILIPLGFVTLVALIYRFVEL